MYNIDLIKKGNKVEFEKVYDDFSGMLYAICFQYVSDRHVSENIVQDSFVRLWEARENLLPATNIRNFLYTITRNLCLNYLRNQRTFWKHLDQLKSLEYDYAIGSLMRLSENFLEFEELQAKVEQAVENLPENLKVVFKMSRFDELKYGEIAEQLHIGEKAVEARISKALKILRHELKDYLLFVFFIYPNFFS